MSEEVKENSQENCEENLAQNSQENEANSNESLSREQELENELANLKDAYMRANAEFENIKKRMEKEKLNAMIYANESFAKDLLDVIDALEAAIKVDASDEISEKIKQGVENTLDLFMKKLEKHGVKLIEHNIEFDPNLHEAMFHVESPEHKSGEIVQVFAKGYQIAQRVIRPTKVSVAK